MTRVLVTGAAGFVGRALCPALQEAGYEARAAVRELNAGELPIAGGAAPGGAEPVTVGDLAGDTDWGAALKGVETVVHLAARAHVLRETATDPLEAYRRVNVQGTEKLAQAAVRQGARRIVFVSSIGVLGAGTPGAPLTEADSPNPHNAYAVSKWEAEQALQWVSADTGLEVVVVRPPLVYGPGVKVNFLRLMRWVERGIPLPLAGVENRRSLLYVGNLVDLLLHCVRHPRAAGETFLASDEQAVSTPELIEKIAAGMERPARLFPFPLYGLKCAARLTGKLAQFDSLCGSLVVNSGKSRELLGRSEPFSLDEGLAATLEWYRSAGGRG